jgi:hypothetical protein
MMIEQNSSQAATTVGAVRRAWNFLLNQENRGALTLIGTFFAAVVAGIWTVYINRLPHPEHLTALPVASKKATLVPYVEDTKGTGVESSTRQAPLGPQFAIVIVQITLKETAPDERLIEIRAVLEAYVKLQGLATDEYEEIMAKHIRKLVLDPKLDANTRILKIREKAADWSVKRESND